MRLFSLLLRLLLSVSLIANGVGFAQATVRMQLAHASHLTATLVAEPGGSTECHEQATGGGDEMPNGMSHAAMGNTDHGAQAPAQGATDDTECCDASSCQCICAQHAFAAFAAGIPSGAMPVAGAAVLRGSPQHLAPRLPHLIRPPIG